MVSIYIVGELRACHDCGAMFPRGVRRCSYCPSCERTRKIAYNRRDYARRQSGTPSARSKRGTLPGGTRLWTLNQKERTLRETHITKIPSCAYCRNYPARLINGVYDCGRPHDG